MTTDRDAGYREGIDAELLEALAMVINPNADWDKPYRDSEHPATLRHESEMASRREAARRLADRILSSGLVAPSTPDDAKAEPVAPFADDGYGSRLLKKATAYLDEYVFGSDEGGDHEPSAFERAMMEDMLNGLFSHEPFFGIIRLLAATHPSPASDGAIRVTDEVVDYIARYGGACRDCADENGICPHSGLPCADRGKAIRHVLTALNYGVVNGFIPAHAGDAAKSGGVLAELVEMPDKQFFKTVMEEQPGSPDTHAEVKNG